MDDIYRMTMLFIKDQQCFSQNVVSVKYIVDANVFDHPTNTINFLLPTFYEIDS